MKYYVKSLILIEATGNHLGVSQAGNSSSQLLNGVSLTHYSLFRYTRGLHRDLKTSKNSVS